MNGNSKLSRRLAAVGAIVVLTVTACASAGDVLGGLGGNTVYGEVRGVDRSRLQVLDESTGRTETLRVDTRTRVVYANREYPVTALERGDIVSVRVERDRNGQRWAESIEVRQSVSDGVYGRDGGVYRRDGSVYDRDGSVYGRNARVQRLDGTVAQIDFRRGAFVLQQSRTAVFTVYVPNNLNREDRRRFERLRRGDRARAEVRPIGRNQFELVRFR